MLQPLRTTAWLYAILFPTVTAQLVSPSNTSVTVIEPDSQPVIIISNVSGRAGSYMLQLALLPLTPGALDITPDQVSGRLFIATSSNFGLIRPNNIAFIPCEPSAYTDDNQSTDLIHVAVNRAAAAVIFFAEDSEHCDLTDAPPYPWFYSTTSRDAVRQFLTTMSGNTGGELFRGMIMTRQESNSTSPGNNEDNNNNPLGPSPSTAVAMIILYSITGIITALFLCIIVTGALRAHRHPERYGPGALLGRPRQSRARGLAQAMLDTIPIVKFGDRSQPKQDDVELADNSNANAERPRENTNQDELSRRNSQSTAVQDTNVARTHTEDTQATAAATSNPPEQDDQNAEIGLGCSICTDDFEVGQDIRVLPCKHKFHPACIDPWLLNVSGTCPLCRVDLHPTTTSESNFNEPSSINDSMAPPLTLDEAGQQRRSSRFLDVHGQGNPEHRFSVALGNWRRQVRDRRNRASFVEGNNSTTGEAMTSLQTDGQVDAQESLHDASEARRARRLTGRFERVFGIRTRRAEEENTAIGMVQGGAGSSTNAPAGVQARI
ncbi:hypothetical protein M501DRAFT_989290 [Patellaria atrata CBS 101060]|uniref:RING-type domain-containing protein n=1 Tax=Patellaria atrata CBS 101060 TaxID=1346257 RepID=A0A9P4VM78_9PEZI|nr:hypothetical protein M501DRAFT_989290 [Patellaria atrata CBS 101060]